MQKQATRHHKTTNTRGNFDLYDDIARIKKSLSNVTRDVKGKANGLLSNSYDELVDKSTALQETIESHIVAKPFKAVGAAAVVGLLVGLLIRK